MRNIVLIFVLFIYLKNAAQKGLTFPYLRGITLDDKSIKVPFANGKYSLVAIAFSRDAQDDLKGWLNPVFETFIQKSDEGGFDLSDVYDINFVFIPAISGFNKIASDFKNGTDKEYWPYIMEPGLGSKELTQNLNITDTKIPYFYVLDKDGKIIEIQSGKYTEDKMLILEKPID